MSQACHEGTIRSTVKIHSPAKDHRLNYLNEPTVFIACPDRLTDITKILCPHIFHWHCTLSDFTEQSDEKVP